MNIRYKYDILGNHNDYDVSISRKKLEEVRNDPFSLGNDVKGLTNMNHQKNLSNYTEELVAHYAKYNGDNYIISLSDLPEDEQNELVRLYIESIDREVSECVYGEDFTLNNDFTCALLALLKDNNHDTRAIFAETTRKNTLLYFTKSLNKLLNEACDFYLHNTMNEQGYYAHTDIEHGDVVWGKF